MTPATFRNWRLDSRLTQAKAAKLFERSRRQIQAWESGETLIPHWVKVVMKGMER